MNQNPFLYKIILLLLVMFSLGINIYAQDDIQKKFPTKKLNRKTDEKRSSYRPKEKKISYIYKKNTKRILYGNPCAIAVTNKWGFEYDVEQSNRSAIINFFKRNWNNLGVKTRLFLTKGPWWKLVIKKRFKDCQRKSGDSTG